MSYISKLNKGIDFIEQHLNDNFELSAVSDAAGMSHWHFQRIFSALTGETLKSYIRARRFSSAMKSLLSTDDRIIDIAVSAGYESHESFTRSFQDYFKMTPNEFRKSGNPHLFMEKIRIDSSYLKQISNNIEKDPEILIFPNRNFVGLGTFFFGVETEKNNMAEKLPELWSKFLPRMDEVPNFIPGAGYGLIRQTKDRSGQLEYFSSVEVSELPKTLPQFMQSITIPSQKYAKFLHRGEVKNLNHSVNYIYSAWLLNSKYFHSSNFDIEEYGEKYHPTSFESEIYYLVPIEDVGSDL
jgi:AraC family transcriptional regulator